MGGHCCHLTFGQASLAAVRHAYRHIKSKHWDLRSHGTKLDYEHKHEPWHWNCIELLDDKWGTHMLILVVFSVTPKPYFRILKKNILIGIILEHIQGLSSFLDSRWNSALEVMIELLIHWDVTIWQSPSNTQRHGWYLNIVGIPKYFCIPNFFLLFNLNHSKRQCSNKTKILFAKGALLTFVLLVKGDISVPQVSVAVLRRIASCVHKQHRWFEKLKKQKQKNDDSHLLFLNPSLLWLSSALFYCWSH